MQQLRDVFAAFYGGLPGWTALAFSIGWFWLFVPLACLTWLFVAWRQPEHRRNAWRVVTVALVAFMSMFYAIYPLHLIAARV